MSFKIVFNVVQTMFIPVVLLVCLITLFSFSYKPPKKPKKPVSGKDLGKVLGEYLDDHVA